MRKNIIVLSLLSLAFSASSFNYKSVDKPERNNSNSYSDTSIPIINNSENQTISDKVLEDIGGVKDIIEIPEVVVPETPHKETYTITFMNADGTILSRQEWEYGEIPSLSDPTLASNDKYRYEFKGWAPEIKEVTSDAIYVAQYKEIKLFDVDVYDGTRLIDSFKHDYKETEIDFHEDRYNREDTDKYTYTFTGYEEEITPVDGDKIYHTTYEENLRTYTIYYYDEHNSLIKSEELEYGAMPVFPVEELELSEKERLIGIKDSSNQPIHYVDGDCYYYPEIEQITYITLNFVVDDETKNVTLPVQENGYFTFPHFLNHNVYYSLVGNDQAIINQGETYHIDQNYSFNVHFGDNNMNPIIKTSKNKDGRVILEAIEYQEYIPSNVSIPSYVLDEETLSLLPVEILGDGINNVFRYPQYDENILSTYLNIPSTATTIKTNAFTNLPSRFSFNIKENITSIETKAFKDNDNTQIYFVNSKEDLSFADILNEYQLSKLHFGEGINILLALDDSETPNYIEIRIKDNNEMVLTKVFMNYGDSFSNTFTLEDSYFFDGESYKITEIDSYAFSDVYGLTSININETVTKFNDYAFKGANDLVSINIPYAVTSIPNSCFENCINLTDINLHDGIKHIGNYAFKNTNLQNESLYCLNYQEEIIGSLVCLPAFVESIGDHAFENVNNNTFLLPKYLNTLGQKVFCDSNSIILFEHKDANEIKNFDNDLGVLDVSQVRWNIRETNRVIPDYQK